MQSFNTTIPSTRPGHSLLGDASEERGMRAGLQDLLAPEVVTQPLVHPPLVVVPLLPDGAPDLNHRMRGSIMQIARQAIDLEVNPLTDVVQTAAQVLQGRACLMLAFHDWDGAVRCAGMELVRVTAIDNPGCRVIGLRGGMGEALLQPDRLTPRLDPKTFQFHSSFPEALLSQWEAAGIMQSVTTDRVQLCPRCGALPTFRRGCRQCGSGSLRQDRLIHHFACAHVGLISDFEIGQHMICPKCRTRNLVIGVDYEYLNGPYQCQECHWTDSELEYVAQCLSCQLRFPGSQAHEAELRGYRAERMDLLALVQTP